MSKGLESWNEIKEYLEYCLELRNGCKAMAYNSTSGYLQPFIEQVEKELKALEILIKVCKENLKYIDLDCLDKKELNLFKEVVLE